MSPIARFALAFMMITVDTVCARVIYDAGTVRLCDPAHPCPPESACMYSPLTPGVKACFTGVANLSRRQGRCPVNGVVQPGKPSLQSLVRPCYFDADCASNEKCCETNTFARVCVPPQTVNPEPTVTILVEGSLNLNPEARNPYYDFKSSVALVQSNGFNVLFDAGGLPQKIEIMNALRDKAGLHLSDIDFIVVSHGHPDHYANVNLFPDVPSNFDMFTIVGDRYVTNPMGQNDPFFLNNDANMELIRTPGHTLQDTSLIVRNVPGRGTLVLSGDIFLTPNDYLGPPQGQDVQLLSQSRITIACMADWILPGHGPMFRVSPEIKTSFGC